MKYEDIQKIRQASGEINYPTKNWLTLLLYGLMTHGTSPGDLEGEILAIERLVELEKEAERVEYSNGWLAQYAEYCAERLLKAGDKLKKG